MHTAYDVAVAGVVACSASYYSVGYDQVIGWAMALTLLFRRRWPMAVLGAVSALALLQYVLAVVPDVAQAGAPTGYDIAVLVAMVSVVTHARAMWQVYTAGAVVVAGVVLGFGGVGSLFTPGAASMDLVPFVAFLGICVAVWLTAVVLRTRRLYAVGLEEKAAVEERERRHLAQLAAAEERAEIARELHDVVAHSLAVMILQADAVGYVLKTDPDKAGTALQTIAATGRDALEDMHRIVRVLRAGRAPGDGEEEGAELGDGRRRASLSGLETLVERARTAGLLVTLTVHGDRDRLPTADQLTVFRVVQECLTNALRHAGPGAAVAVTLSCEEDVVHIEVSDDGGGRLGAPAPAGAEGVAGGGNGLVGMRERVEVSGGRFTAGPRLGAGWRVEADLPAKAGAAT
ncbi:sensor histidine kinase [Streptomyces shenzhenensis]|uniref:sensor histidine kinase n=1 Tax=Streptomyces shenzhenensis TaxID=943815 RepID=UPI0015F04D2B|nr:histidine kinase [Streptomyces shenzhenensis]